MSLSRKGKNNNTKRIGILDGNSRKVPKSHFLSMANMLSAIPKGWLEFVVAVVVYTYGTRISLTISTMILKRD